MNQREAVIHVMRENGGYATLAHLYEHALKVPDIEWRTRTPFASIRRIVQNRKYFFRIRPGLWALNEYKDSLPFAAQIDEKSSDNKGREFSHSYYQGLLLEIGNLKKLGTFVPNQDKNKLFLERPLKEVATISQFYDFGYSNFVDVAQTVDVSWFNERRMPNTFVEVEHSTNFTNSLVKFVELQDFNVAFWIAAPPERKAEFKSKLTRSAFAPISDRIVFIDYDEVSKLHSSLTEQALIEQGLVAQ